MEPSAILAVEVDVHLADGSPFDLAGDARIGLAQDFKQLAPKYFYDERGSTLFEQITEQPEYYPTRAERKILELYSGEIAAAAQASCLIELGSGSANKTRHLISAMREVDLIETYVPVDISEEITRQTAAALAEEYPGLKVRGVVCDFEHHLEYLPSSCGTRLIAFLGGTIGNFPPAARSAFLARIGALLEPGEALLLGTDLVKDHDVLEAAYDDAAGVTAEFNKNVLAVLNRELGADFDLDRFEHVARFDPVCECMDIRLRSTAEQSVRLPGIEMEISFAAGEEMRTELSCKFTRASLEGAYSEAGLSLEQLWTDPDGLYALSLARRA